MKSLCCTDDIDGLRSSLEVKGKIAIGELNKLIECEVSDFKWHESREVGYDIGEDEAFRIWKEEYGKEFFEYWSPKVKA